MKIGKSFLPVIVIILIILAVFGIKYFGDDKNVEEEELALMDCDVDKDKRTNIIKALDAGWPEFEKSIESRPVLGATTWNNPHQYQFIGNNKMIASFEDGHVALAAIVGYECDEGIAQDFSVAETSDEFPFYAVKWNSLYDKYGDKNYGFYSYTRSISMGGKLVEFEDWTEVPQNIFIYSSKGY